MTRQEANKELVKILSELVEKHPELRFIQLLDAFDFLDGTPVGDLFYLESKETLELVNKSLKDRL